MRRFFPFLALLVVGCSNGPAPDDHLKPSPYVADSTKHRLFKIINGGWVCKDYIDSFNRYHSPVFANGDLPVLQMAFDTSKLNGDTMYNGFHRKIYNATERFDVVFKNDNGRIRMIPRTYPDVNVKLEELGFVINNSDTILVLSVAGKTYEFERVFHRFPEYGEVELSALDVYVDKWFSQYWWMLNGAGVSFSEDGTMGYYEGYKRYSIKTKSDYPHSESDEITLYNDTAGVSYAWRIRREDSRSPEILELFELRAKDGEMERGSSVATFRGQPYIQF